MSAAEIKHETNPDADLPTPKPFAAKAKAPGDSQGALQEMIFDGPFERCLDPLLRAAGWRGDTRQIIEALPHLEQLQSVNDLRVVLHRLGFRSSNDLLRVEEIIDERLPALWMESGSPIVLLETRADGKFWVYDSVTQEEFELTPPGRRMHLCRVYATMDRETASAQQEAEGEWLKGAIFRLGGEMSFALFLTFVANVLALAPPLFTMTVYNAILPAEGLETLAYLVAAAVAAIACETFLRRMRSGVLSTSAARLNCEIIIVSFARILKLPSAMVESASVSAQTGRIKQFEGIVSAFSGPVLGAVFDLPFVVVFLIAIALLGGPLVFAPITAIAFFVLFGALLAPLAARAGRKAALLKDRASALTFEMLTSLETIHDIGAEAVWRRRVGDAHQQAVGARTKAAFLDYLRSGGSMFFIAMSMIATVCGGAVMAMNGDLTVGALVAISMLGARVLGPVQTLFMAVQQITASREASKRFESLLRLKVDRQDDKAPAAFRPFKGGVSLREVAFRFPGADEFALRGVSAEIKPGEIIGLVGPGGSGRTTLLKLILGLYRPVSGQIGLDGANMAQIHPAELRTAIAYAPSEPEFFYGTIAQNMTLGRPTATNDEIEAVFDEIGVRLDPAIFSQGLETRLGAQDFSSLPAALRQKLSIARTLLKNAPITLFDEPVAVLEPAEQKAVFRALARRRGRATIILTINQVSHFQVCDRVMALAGGKIARFDTPAALLQEVSERRGA